MLSFFKRLREPSIYEDVATFTDPNSAYWNQPSPTELENKATIQAAVTFLSELFARIAAAHKQDLMQLNPVAPEFQALANQAQKRAKVAQNAAVEMADTEFGKQITNEALSCLKRTRYDFW